ncbi:unnamed protein product [Vitrella brassicaformis CCMP3155]|uniref:Uncharacterized protein n=1 Tax=Vitrella brassicaformis (strain CCMP3155) TaxID=1169540 RepID=A0A0G4EUA1_VITBC|nr:unnamed protein product [Vitrella brassicaformis CCMP3155]|eukprot:CEM01863.1 unnamed protein product [Vitrella brassicaformis CCMP3155]
MPVPIKVVNADMGVSRLPQLPKTLGELEQQVCEGKRYTPKQISVTGVIDTLDAVVLTKESYPAFLKAATAAREKITVRINDVSGWDDLTQSYHPGGGAKRPAFLPPRDKQPNTSSTTSSTATGHQAAARLAAPLRLAVDRLTEGEGIAEVRQWLEGVWGGMDPKVRSMVSQALKVVGIAIVCLALSQMAFVSSHSSHSHESAALRAEIALERERNANLSSRIALLEQELQTTHEAIHTKATDLSNLARSLSPADQLPLVHLANDLKRISKQPEDTTVPLFFLNVSQPTVMHTRSAFSGFYPFSDHAALPRPAHVPAPHLLSYPLSSHEKHCHACSGGSSSSKSSSGNVKADGGLPPTCKRGSYAEEMELRWEDRPFSAKKGSPGKYEAVLVPLSLSLAPSLMGNATLMVSYTRTPGADNDQASPPQPVINESSLAAQKENLEMCVGQYLNQTILSKHDAGKTADGEEVNGKGKGKAVGETAKVVTTKVESVRRHGKQASANFRNASRMDEEKRRLEELQRRALQEEIDRLAKALREQNAKLTQLKNCDAKTLTWTIADFQEKQQTYGVGKLLLSQPTSLSGISPVRLELYPSGRRPHEDASLDILGRFVGRTYHLALPSPARTGTSALALPAPAVTVVSFLPPPPSTYFGLLPAPPPKTLHALVHRNYNTQVALVAQRHIKLEHGECKHRQQTADDGDGRQQVDRRLVEAREYPVVVYRGSSALQGFESPSIASLKIGVQVSMTSPHSRPCVVLKETKSLRPQAGETYRAAFSPRKCLRKMRDAAADLSIAMTLHSINGSQAKYFSREVCPTPTEVQLPSVH